MGLRLEVDYDKCSGLGLCEAEAPDLFEVQDDGSLTVHDLTPGEEHRAACQAAVASCPTEALRLIEDTPIERCQPVERSDATKSPW